MDNKLKRKLIASLDATPSKPKTYDMMDLSIMSTIQPTSPEVSDFYLSMRRKGCSNEEIIEMVKAMEQPLNEEIAAHLKKLLYIRDVSTSSFGEKSFLSDGYVRQVLAGKKSLSKETLFGLCLYLELPEKEVKKFLDIYGLELSKSIEDVTFQKYIEKGSYKLRDYVEDCVRLASAAGVKLPKFFYKEYTNETYRTK